MDPLPSSTPSAAEVAVASDTTSVRLTLSTETTVLEDRLVLNDGTPSDDSDAGGLGAFTDFRTVPVAFDRFALVPLRLDTVEEPGETRTANWVRLGRAGSRLDLRMGASFSHQLTRTFAVEAEGQVVLAVTERSLTQRRVIASRGSSSAGDWAALFLRDSLRPAASARINLRYQPTRSFEVSAYAGYRADFNRASVSFAAQDHHLGQARFQGGAEIAFSF